MTTKPRSENKRRESIDFIKGVAIFLVLWGHSIQYSSVGALDFFDDTVYKIIYSFHMPLFMMISGYLFWGSFKKRDFRSLVIKKTHSLLQPIVICGILFYYATDGIRFLIQGEYSGIISGAWLGTLGGYWFLWSVLGASLAVGGAYGLSNNHITNGVLIIIGFMFVVLFPNWENNVYMYPFFLVGFLFGKYRETQIAKVAVRVRYIAIPLFITMSFFFRKEHIIYVSGIRNFSIDAFRWAIGFMGSSMIIVLCDDIIRLKKKSAIIRIICRLGAYSLQIYLLQRIVLEVYYAKLYAMIVERIGTNILAENIFLYDYIFTPVIAICFSFLILGITCLMEHQGIGKILFGR